MNPAPVDPDRLAEVLAFAGPLWSGPSDGDRVKVHHGYRQVTVAAGGNVCHPELGWLLEQFAPVWGAWLGRLDPGGWIRPHIDAGPYRERWQVPICGDCTFRVDGATFHPTPGVPFRVHHHLWHAVDNLGPGPRVALVVDRDVLLPIPSGPLEVTPDGSR